MEISGFVNYVISLLVICNPFAALPALIGMTKGLSIKEKKRTGAVAGTAVGVILLTMTWFGSWILDFLGITVPAFQVTGGVVIFLLALSMLNAETSRQKQAEDEEDSSLKSSIAIVPLAIPIMAGPGAISTVIVAANGLHGFWNLVLLSLAAVLVALILAVTLYFSTPFEKALGQRGINIINRIAGLILAAIAIQTLSKGLVGLFPVLKGAPSTF
jgi:multiple antibiotic resistance protein